jgi:hypothetical protein
VPDVLDAERWPAGQPDRRHDKGEQPARAVASAGSVFASAWNIPEHTKISPDAMKSS